MEVDSSIPRNRIAGAPTQRGSLIFLAGVVSRLRDVGFESAVKHDDAFQVYVHLDAVHELFSPGSMVEFTYLGGTYVAIVVSFDWVEKHRRVGIALVKFTVWAELSSTGWTL